MRTENYRMNAILVISCKEKMTIMVIRKLLSLFIILTGLFITGCENNSFFEEPIKLPFDIDRKSVV